ncbi:hypothetical protein MNBD_ALPHA09-1189 [hydrothermal vent metagenome]|uniref:ETC complex I subunit n=1 Tax=hydrothermal vent metagenome TaxID=652676 RepID=A0A3B0TNG8_9ZZZZ
MVARIYKPAKTSMQSGMARSKSWMLDYEPETRRVVEPLMGWTGSSDVKAQTRLSFQSKKEAVEYAERHGIAYEVSEPHGRVLRPKTYSDNFRYGRREPWTH